ncbi:VOC family protein [Kitasatospora aureofaciens]|uniref:VOC family protein n=1 Tax=Kitasatospora aureofaciens TaxID=1894 RepID=UPI001C46F1B6|nr:VOC family protein [Kitasatospora aureofaciens]MBV6697772.1 VOC family protein [Kitasatospora aureofaciens]
MSTKHRHHHNTIDLTCSHILCKVDDIRTAVADFAAAGFTVTWGSTPAKAHNALIWFESGPFIELFELPRRFGLLRLPFGLAYGAPAGARLARWAAPGEGWRDVALETEETDLVGAHLALQETGIPGSRVMKGRRITPDGTRVRYQFLAPRPHLPFVVSAYDPPQRPATVTHPNGAHSITRVRFDVAERDRKAFDTLAGADPWLAAEPAARTAVRSVELAGLTGEIDPATVHGAVFERSPACS